MTVWRWIRAVAAFWIGFVIGDDWTVAAVIAVALLATWALVHAGVAAWWLLPLAVSGATARTVRRAVVRERD